MDCMCVLKGDPLSQYRETINENTVELIKRNRGSRGEYSKKV